MSQGLPIKILCDLFQTKLELLENDGSLRAAEVQKEVGHRRELEREILLVRRDLKMAKENISSLESQVK